jgi:hypothetical protein
MEDEKEKRTSSLQVAADQRSSEIPVSLVLLRVNVDVLEESGITRPNSGRSLLSSCLEPQRISV